MTSQKHVLTKLHDSENKIATYLIFVTDLTDISVEKKFVMWRNFIFLHSFYTEKSENFQNFPPLSCIEIVNFST